jgi:hypothetical protein
MAMNSSPGITNHNSDLLERANEIGARGMSALADTLSRAGTYVESHARDFDLDPSDLRTVTAPIGRAADYLRTQDPKAAVQDLDKSIHAHPYRSIAIGFGVGFLIARWL